MDEARRAATLGLRPGQGPGGLTRIDEEAAVNPAAPAVGGSNLGPGAVPRLDDQLEPLG